MAQGMIQPISPNLTVTISASTTSANALINTASGDSLLIYNSTGSVAFVALGTDNTVVATSANYPVPAGGTRLINIGSIVQSVAVILASGSGSVYCTRGNGTVY